MIRGQTGLRRRRDHLLSLVYDDSLYTGNLSLRDGEASQRFWAKGAQQGGAAAGDVTIDEILRQLAAGATLEGPHWTEPVSVLAVKARGTRVEVQAVGLHTKRLWNKLLKLEDFDGPITITQAGELAALTGNPTHFRLAAEAHRIRLAFQYDPHFAVSVSQVDPLPHQMDAVYSHLLTGVLPVFWSTSNGSTSQKMHVS